MSQDHLLEKLPEAISKAENLPSPPTVAVEVLRISNDEDATINDLTKVLSLDPALSAKLLKLANSSSFRRGDEVTSLDMATMRLGMKTVKLMALSFSLTSDLPRKDDRDCFDYFAYWSRCLTMAVAGRSLTRLVKNRNGDEAFLCGLLGRLGQLVMAQCLGDDYERLVKESEGDLPAASLEAERIGYDFHQVGAGLLAKWELPSLIWQTVGHWGQPEQLPDDASDQLRDLVRVMHLADQTTTVICSPHKGCALKNLQARSQEYFGVSEEELATFIVSLEEDVAEMASMLNVDVDHASYQSIIDQARNEMVQISLGAAMDLQQTETRAEELEKENKELLGLASTDKLTGIPNRASFDNTLEQVIEARMAGQSSNPLGILILDVDHFKNFNDTHGHQVGDEVLKVVANALKAATRGTDIAARYGGEEFVVIVSNASLDILERIAERIRTRIEESSLEHEGSTLSVTASVGGAWIERVESEAIGAELMARADACLYEAKRAGRNRSLCKSLHGD